MPIEIPWPIQIIVSFIGIAVIGVTYYWRVIR